MIKRAIYSWRGHSSVMKRSMGMVWGMSVNWANQWFDTTLVTDRKGREFLIDRLQLPFGEVLELPEIPDDLCHVYDLPKLHAASMMCRRGEPYLHIDHDAFLTKGIPDSLKEAPFVCEFAYESGKYLEGLNLRLPKPVFERVPPRCLATGICGGNDLDLILKYATASIETATDPANRAALSQENGYQASVLIGEAVPWEVFRDRAMALLPRGNTHHEDYDAAGYVHLADGKRDNGTLALVENQFAMDFPEEHRRIHRRYRD